ncbi:MAG: small multi-drug export protein [Campylobacteraceae bacterium]|nr:small multi-drug export protein [Campylobacteraceae bacterium]
MKELLEKLFQGKAGNIFIFGLFLFFCLLLFIIISYRIDITFANKITGIVLTNVLVGRVPALSFAYAVELSHIVAISVNVLIELILVCIIYPLFVLSFNGILKIELLENFFNTIKTKKKKHQKSFDRYGSFGLFLFVFIPFWMTGPIVGAIIGFLIGLKHYTIITVVAFSTFIAISLWGLFLQEIIDFLLAFDSEFIWLVLFVLLSILLIYRFKR